MCAKPRILVGVTFLSSALVSLTVLGPSLALSAAVSPALWQLAQREAAHHRFSTLFTAQDVRDRLGSESGLAQAIDWCKLTGVTRVYLETFRDGYRAQSATLERAKREFLAQGFLVSGCVTTTGLGKRSTGWNVVSCYTDKSTQVQLKGNFEFTAGLFDEIMIDDFWFTDCTCPDCEAGRKARTVVVGDNSFPVAGDTWEDYRCELMVRISRQLVLGAAKAVNSKARLIIKYPQWYDRFQDRGYDVLRETADFDKIWVGTETRDFRDPRWGGTVQYEAYFIMRWLGGIGGSKCGGGWFDSLGTTEKTYLEQARQTVLAGAAESMLFAFGGLQHNPGAADILALRTNLPELLALAKEVRRRQPVGLAAYKPANSHPEKEARVFDFVGMLGLPLVPCHEFPATAPTAFFSCHALKDPDLVSRLTAYLRSGKPVLVTDGLAQALAGKLKLDGPQVRILPVQGEPKNLLNLKPAELEPLRKPFLDALHCEFRAPNQAALYLFSDGSWVIENFSDSPVDVELRGDSCQIEARGWRYRWK